MKQVVLRLYGQRSRHKWGGQSTETLESESHSTLNFTFTHVKKEQHRLFTFTTIHSLCTNPKKLNHG